MIKSRFNIGDILPDNIIGCELGVFEGDFSEVLIKTGKFSKLYLVDLFDGLIESGDTNGNNIKIKSGSELQKSVIDRFKENDSIIILKNDSVSFLNSAPDNYFDFIYIDTSHQYEHTKVELELAFQKVKLGGIIAGHDYNEQHFYGVVKAVNEFSLSKSIPIHLTTEDNLETFYFFKN